MINTLRIIKFRGIKDKEIKLGENITILAGKNGTQKSTILGLLGQPFVFYGNKHFTSLKKEIIDEIEEKLKEKIDSKNDILNIFGKNFETKFSDLFKFSSKYDFNEEYRYILEIDKDYFNKEKCFMGTKPRPGENVRMNHFTNENFGTYGVYRDFVYPTIYLGLSRLYPIGESKKIKEKIDVDFFSNKDLKAEFKRNYNRILKQVDEFNENIIEKDTGETIGIDTGYYDYLGNSSGQDNVGKILGSLLSFKNLKLKYKNYRGGLLLIDELDAALFAASQFTLYEVIKSYAKELNLKVVFTTHSLELIKYIKDKNKTEDKLYYFTKVGKEINISENPDFKEIYNNISQKIDKKIERNKIRIYTEDEVACKFLKEILKPNLRISLMNFIGLKMDWKSMKISNSKFVLDNDIFIYDGDVNKKEIKGKNELKLPLDKALEQEMLIYLNEKEANHEIWDMFSFTKNYFENKIINEYKVNLNSVSSCKNVLNDKTFSIEVFNRFLKYWSQDNKSNIQEFIKNFKEKYEAINKIDCYSWEEITK
mgnify:CR=1 FL=1